MCSSACSRVHVKAMPFLPQSCSSLLFFKVHFVYKCFTFMHVYVPHACLSEDEVRSPKTGVTEGVNHQVGAGKEPQVLCKSSKHF